MWMNLLLLIGGLALILIGANGLTDGAASVAKRFRISDLVIGLTIVAFGTSAPELVISVLSSLQGSAEMAIGNVVGSNIFNVLMIIGCTALVLTCFANDCILDGGSRDIISRIDGLVLLGFFLIFMRYTFAIARNGNEDGGEEQKVKELPAWKSALYIIGGLAGLIFGGQFFVDGASGIARSLGVSDSIIGLTLVAGGTSLPELATSVTAALKKNPGIAIGNVIGSNLFNVFFVLGCSASLSPLPMGNINNIDMVVLVGSSILFWLVGWFFKKRTITRIEGGLLVACYIAYTAFLISQQ